MKRFVFFLASAIVIMSNFAYSQFDVVWSKEMPNRVQIEEVKFSHDSRFLLCLAPDLPTLQIFDVHTGELFNDKVPRVSQPIFSKDDSHVFGFGGTKLAYYNLNTGVSDIDFEPSPKPIKTTALSDNEKYYIAVTDDGFHVWDVQTGKIIKTKKLFSNDNVYIYHGWIYKLSISCDNNKIYVLKGDKYFDGVYSAQRVPGVPGKGYHLC